MSLDETQFYNAFQTLLTFLTISNSDRHCRFTGTLLTNSILVCDCKTSHIQAYMTIIVYFYNAYQTPLTFLTIYNWYTQKNYRYLLHLQILNSFNITSIQYTGLYDYESLRNALKTVDT